MAAAAVTAAEVAAAVTLAVEAVITAAAVMVVAAVAAAAASAFGGAAAVAAVAAIGAGGMAIGTGAVGITSPSFLLPRQAARAKPIGVTVCRAPSRSPECYRVQGPGCQRTIAGLRLFAGDAANIAKVLTEDKARRIASNIAKLPDLVGKPKR